MSHSQITTEQRFKIQSWLELGLSQAAIAERLTLNQSSISRELARNPYPNGRYHAGHARLLSRQRRKAGRHRTKKLVKDKRLRRVVLHRLREKDSPEQIAGKRKRQEKDYVVHETIYQYLYTERRDLLPLLRQQKGKYRRRHGTREREKLRELSKKTWITERPDTINIRRDLGHWEGDTVRGKEKTTAMVTHVERVSGYGMAGFLPKVTATLTREMTVRQFQRIPQAKRGSITYDNGTEFTEHELTGRALGTEIYFALPYHSWERGTNENWNGLLRQFFPKGMAFATLTQQDVEQAVHNLNHRPRKRLNYLTPHEVFVKGMKP